jgi:hypothetical protein
MLTSFSESIFFFSCVHHYANLIAFVISIPFFLALDKKKLPYKTLDIAGEPRRPISLALGNR